MNTGGKGPLGRQAAALQRDPLRRPASQHISDDRGRLGGDRREGDREDRSREKRRNSDESEEEGDGEHRMKGCNSGGHVRIRKRLELVIFFLDFDARDGACSRTFASATRASNWCKYDRQGSNIDELAKETASDIRLPTFAGCISQASSPDPRITCTFHLFRMSHNSH